MKKSSSPALLIFVFALSNLFSLLTLATESCEIVFTRLKSRPLPNQIAWYLSQAKLEKGEPEAKRSEAALERAAHDKNLDVVKALVDKGIEFFGRHERDRKFFDTIDLNNKVRDFLIAHVRTLARNLDQAGKDSALFKFADEGGVTAARILLEEGANPNAYAGRYAGPLHMAAFHQSDVMVDLLLEFGADPRITDNQGRKALSYARYRGIPEALKAAESDPGHRAKIQQKQKIRSMEQAIQLNRFAELKNLVGEDTNIDKINPQNDGVSLLMRAAQSGRIEMAEFLIAHGANVNYGRVSEYYRGENALMWAAKEGHSRMIEFLVSKGANVNAMDAHGRSALHFAIRASKEGAIRSLLNLKADVTLRDDTGSTPIMGISFSDVRLLKYLIFEKDINPNIEDAAGETLLDGFIKSNERGYTGYAPVIQLLTEVKNNPRFPRVKFDFASASQVQKQAALREALKKQDLAKIDELIKIGTEISFEKGSQALFYCAAGGFLKSLTHLITKGVNIHVIDPDTGNNLLHTAAHEGKLNVVKLLVKLGVDRHLENNTHFTPAELAWDNQMEKARNYLNGLDKK